MITPILRDPKAHGGTLYTFPSASRDLTRSFSNSEYEFAFSHFACLNLPDFRYGNYECVDSDSESDIYFDSDPNSPKDPKGIYLDDLYPNSISTVNNLNKSLKWHLQSYVMNCEVAILNGFSLDSGKYDSEILRTPSERIFFNWLQKVKAIKFKGNRETLDGYGYGHDYDFNVDFGELVSESQLSTADRTKSYRIGNKLYTWKAGEWRYRVLVSKTVQYIGTIDMVNNVNIDSDSFNEIYINIPAGVGGSTYVHFNNVFDANYSIGEIIDVRNDKYLHLEDTNAECIIGRHYQHVDTDQLDTVKAIYDPAIYLGTSSNSDYDKEKCYKIDTGYCINFSDNLYNDNNGNVGIDAMNFASEEDFEFNCILIYYRIRKGDGEWFTNLYGVLFLEEVTTSDYNTYLNDDDERIGYIQRYPKFKKGNSWGLKLDLKIDAQPDSQLELRDKQYDDPNSGAGMQIFAEALLQLNECAKIFYELKNDKANIEERLYKLENMTSGIDTVYDLRDEVGALRTRLEIIQPNYDMLEGRIENMEVKMEKMENNLGNLINNIIGMKDKITLIGNKLNELIIDDDGKSIQIIPNN